MLFATIVFVVAILISRMDVVNSSIMPNPIGETVPNGDIYVESDGSLEIMCVVYGNATYGDMKFISDEYDVSSYVSKVNSTTIRLYIENPKPQCQMYQCLMGNQIVDQNFVFVTVKPSNMKCFSYNYERLNCFFKSSELPSNAKYEARYELIGKRFNNRKWTAIDNVTALNNEEYYFVLDESTSVPYRSVYGKIKVFLNIFIDIPKFHISKQYTLNATFDESKHVIPGPAAKLHATTITAQYVEIAYYLSSRMNYVTYPIKHMILWSCNCGRKQWAGKDSFNASTNSIVYQITDLPYAYALCNISVYLKVAQAPYDGMWSNTSTLDRIRTGSKAPENPPVIIQGAFQIDQTLNETHAVIYWKEIPEELRNGPNFTYEIKVEDPGFEEIETEDSFAIVENLNVSATTTIQIRSKNSEGLSNKTVLVDIPNINDTIVRNLESFTQWTNSSGITYLSWELPKYIGKNLTNELAVFACDSWKEETRLCHGQLDTVNITKSPQGSFYEVSKSSTNNKKYAVAFKTLKSWTGLLWSMCSIDDKGPSLPEIQLSIVDVGITKIGLKWVLNCKDMVVPISGYVMSYCKASKEQEKCDDPITNITIKGDKTAGHYEIEYLEFETRYLIWVRTETYFGKQQRSKILPYYNEFKLDYVAILWIVLGIVFLIGAAVFSTKFYKKCRTCWKIGVKLPPGLQVGSSDKQINGKPIQTLHSSLNTKVQEIIPNTYNRQTIPPAPSRLMKNSSEVSLQLSSNSQRISFGEAKPEIPAIQQYEEEDLEDVAGSHLDMDGSNINESLRSLLQPDKISHPYVTSGTIIPDVIYIPSRQKSELIAYVALGERNNSAATAKRNVDKPYGVAGNCNVGNEVETPSNNKHSTQDISLDELHKPTITEHNSSSVIPPTETETTFCNPYVTFDSFVSNSESEGFENKLQHPYVMAASIDESALKSQKKQYLPSDDFHNTIEEAPLLQLPESPTPYVLFEQLETRTDLPTASRPGNVLRGTYSDTPE